MGLPFEKFVNSKLLLDVCRYTIILDGYFLDAPKLIGVGVLVFLLSAKFCQISTLKTQFWTIYIKDFSLKKWPKLAKLVIKF
jgi:hypothetical protein